MILVVEEWSRRLEEPKIEEEVIKVLPKFFRAKGLKVKFE